MKDGDMDVVAVAIVPIAIEDNRNALVDAPTVEEKEGDVEDV